ncbi:hypothetical protein [Nocardioides acrostichi]|uniref:Uncharacterized protein n=1 Tax=Nocardioides acrostichi TaxID=2784339 RepID=A0A930V4S5_9ACTN|nr:hypothetical protein [Nocardioides acrostichi]MBF4163174.1 hypothetical protein [Nocardioides acrostichi]
MNQKSDHPTDSRLRTALHDRALAEPVDVDRLVAGSLTCGRRLRARRRATLGGSALAIAAVAAGVVWLVPHEGSAEAGFAASPTAGTSDSPTASSSPTATPTLRSLQEVKDSLDAADYSLAIDPPAGWSCTEPADDKFTCTQESTGHAVAVTIRGIAQHDDYDGGDPDKTSYLVTDGHDGHFATLNPYAGATGEDVQTIAESFTWSS